MRILPDNNMRAAGWRICVAAKGVPVTGGVAGERAVARAAFYGYTGPVSPTLRAPAGPVQRPVWLAPKPISTPG
ncbi:hypothetical protein CBM2634_U150003 [Cupriavidus taiwanensis]|uniref:Uncharacterized protein n=1 Tax=Cupriavidus taiwanensis TaxID=164546 RepID=A0A375JD99_9BURK|nr:hypothetical protein CBM2634_U150003 [Cupriavidus taiwanensis]